MQASEPIAISYAGPDGAPGSGALPAPLGVPATGALGNAPLQPAARSGAPRSSPEERAKWRAKGARSRALKAGLPLNAPAPLPGASLPGAPLAPGANAPFPGGALPERPPVLWTPGTLRPLFNQCVPVLEELDVRSLKTLAADVGPHALALVAERAAWNPVAKAALLESGPATIAEWMNESGVDARNAPMLTLLTACAAIGYASYTLRTELKELAAKKEPKKELPTSNAQLPTSKNQPKESHDHSHLETKATAL